MTRQSPGRGARIAQLRRITDRLRQRQQPAPAAAPAPAAGPSSGPTLQPPGASTQPQPSPPTSAPAGGTSPQPTADTPRSAGGTGGSRWWTRLERSVALLVSVSTLVAAGAALVTVRQASGEQHLTRDGQATDRYTAAVTNLGDAAEEVRISGMYALQRSAQDSPRDAPTVVQVLAAYIRSHAPKTGHTTKGSPSPANDIAAALGILAVPLAKGVVVDLHGTNLAGADLHSADLPSAVLVGADLTHAVLANADLTGANLTRADLDRANLGGASLTRADLHGADLTGADLNGALLLGADLTGAFLVATDLTDANLTGANLTDANLDHAHLTGVHGHPLAWPSPSAS
ncbi:pentapeptide repeat-containing protein [Streptomyces sp. NPDC051976]|uniref:pentapeptide repeat-containing protein n=1 Tax=Streptomyces sp. NPDC051976 TaxID=3154947 RepID=UPI00344ADBCE